MSEAAQTELPEAERDGGDLASWRQRVRGANINDTSLLATDYLNHFNEVVMMIEMIADVPECLDDVREWAPKTYQEHFADSSFSDKNLAIAAYDHAPAEFRGPLEDTVDQINRLIALSVARIGVALEADDAAAIRTVARRATRDLQRLVEVVGALINGASPTIGQGDIDAMFQD